MEGQDVTVMQLRLLALPGLALLAPAAGLPEIGQEDILSVAPEMSAFLDGYAGPGQNEYFRLKRLLYAVMGEGKFELVCDDRTRTAQ